MPRNFGISFEKVTTRATVGETNRAGLTTAQVTRADSNSCPIQGEADLSDCELAVKCFFFGSLTVAGVFLFAVWFVISNFVA